MALYFGGIEGGGSSSNMVIINQNGDVMGRSCGEGTNQWIIGIDLCVDRIHGMVVEAKRDAGLPEDTPLTSLGMGLSGADQIEKRRLLVDHIQQRYPNDASSHCVLNDIFGSIATACEKGGMALISGTGSNCLLMMDADHIYSCGGMGHLLGDEGSAYWIAVQAIRTVLHLRDGFISTENSTACLEKLYDQYFDVKDKFDILPHFHDYFSKKKIAGFTEVIARVCTETGDQLCGQLFFEAGEMLAKHVTAVLGRAKFDPETWLCTVVCVGSVWKSWSLLEKGFRSGISKFVPTESSPKNLQLVHLVVSSALGAARLGAASISHTITMNFSQNYKEFCKVNLS